MAYGKLTPEISEQLKEVVGGKRFFTGDAIAPDYSHDEMPIYLRESVGDTVYGLMSRIKRVFDPDLILNPGKVCVDLQKA